MKYRIEVSGGFMGRVKEYEGELHLSQESRARILKWVQTPIAPKVNLRDGLRYSFTLQEGKLSYSANFDDTNLPEPLRDLMENVKKQG